MFQTGPKCFKTVKNYLKLSIMVHILSKMVQNCPIWYNLVCYGLIWPKLCLQTHPNGCGITRSPVLVCIGKQCSIYTTYNLFGGTLSLTQEQEERPECTHYFYFFPLFPQNKPFLSLSGQMNS